MWSTAVDVVIPSSQIFASYRVSKLLQSFQSPVSALRAQANISCVSCVTIIAQRHNDSSKIGDWSLRERFTCSLRRFTSFFFRNGCKMRRDFDVGCARETCQHYIPFAPSRAVLQTQHGSRQLKIQRLQVLSYRHLTGDLSRVSEALQVLDATEGDTETGEGETVKVRTHTHTRARRSKKKTSG